MALALDFRRQLIKFLLLYLFILLVLVGINLWLGYDINRHVLTIQSNKRDLFSYVHAIDTLSSLNIDAARAKSERPFLESILPQSEELINFSRDLGVLAKQASVESSFNFGSEVVGGDSEPGFIYYNLSITGAFSNWLRFLEILEKDRRFMTFDVFNITSDGKTHRLNINGKVFTQ